MTQQVLSRAFGSEDALALAPLIDLLNHRHGAAKPAALVVPSDDATGGRQFVWTDGNSEAAVGIDSSNSGGHGSSSLTRDDDDKRNDSHVYVCVSTTSHGRHLPLEPGDELCISYVGGRRNRAGRINALLNFGFIPTELL